MLASTWCSQPRLRSHVSSAGAAGSSFTPSAYQATRRCSVHGRGARVHYQHIRNTADAYVDSGKRVKVSFKLPYRCSFGQEICIVGSGDKLGNWQVQNGVKMQWSENDVWQVEFEVTAGGNLELEYKYVVRDPDGGVVCWKPGNNYELRVPVLLEAERAIAEGVRVRDAWDGSIQDIELQVMDLEPSSQSRTAEEERAAVESAMNRALDELTETLNNSISMAASFEDPTAPELLQADRLVAAATRKAVAMSRALNTTVSYPDSMLPLSDDVLPQLEEGGQSQ